MDANDMSINAIKEGIERGYYNLTGILDTGEIIISIISSHTMSIIEECGLSTQKEFNKLNELLRDNPNDKTILKFYNQKCAVGQNRNKTNGLIRR